MQIESQVEAGEYSAMVKDKAGADPPKAGGRVQLSISNRYIHGIGRLATLWYDAEEDDTQMQA